MDEKDVEFTHSDSRELSPLKLSPDSHFNLSLLCITLQLCRVSFNTLGYENSGLTDCGNLGVSRICLHVLYLTKRYLPVETNQA